MTTAQLIISVISAVGGLTGVVTLLKVRSEKRKMASEAGRTDAETNRILADTRLDRETKIIEMYERTVDKVQEDNEILNAKLDRLTEYVETLIREMRAANMSIPPMPPYQRTNGFSHGGADH